MRLGIFSKTFRRPTLDGVLAEIASLGIRDAHFNLASVGLETLPAQLSESQCSEIRDSFHRHRITMCGISGTFNAIHPDTSLRQELIARACLLIERCSSLRTRLVTLCTGTRNPDDMWKHDPENQSESAWDDLCSTLDQLLKVAEQHSVFLGIEPEQANVIDSASKAHRLLDEFRSPCLKIVLDAANLLHAGNLHDVESVLSEATDLLGSEIVMAHAKDIPRRQGGSVAAGSGLLAWDIYLRTLATSGFCGPLVMHGLEEAEAPGSVKFLTDRLNTIAHVSHPWN